MHDDIDNPSSASMFSTNTAKSKPASESSPIVSGMMSVVSTVCDAVANKPQVSTLTNKSSTSSPMKKAELRSAYMKQLSDLKELYDKEILDIEEYEEQRLDIVNLIRTLN